MTLLVGVGSLLGLTMYVPLFLDIILDRSEQNFASLMLWSAFDAIIALSIYRQHGNYFLAATYSLSSAVIALATLKNGFVWTKLETAISIPVVGCAITWIGADPKLATIAGTIAFLIAGIPTVLDTYKNPGKAPFLIYFGFFTADALAMAGGKNWSVQERLYPAACAAFCLTILFLAFRASWRALVPFRTSLTASSLSSSVHIT